MPPPGGPLPAPPPAGRSKLEAWGERWWRWDAYFAVVAVGSAAFVASDRPESTPARIAAVALIVAMAGWYAGFGRALLRGEEEDWRGYVYLGGLLVLFAGAVGLADSSSFVLLAIAPQAYMAMPAGPATAVVVAFAATQTGAFLIRTGDLRDTVRIQLPIAAIIVLIAAFTGTWGRRMAGQNTERAELIEQLETSRGEVARLSHEAGVTAERQRLAGDIHDTVAQGLSSVVMLVQAADAALDRDHEEARRHLAFAARIARENLAESRALVAALTPAPLADSSLADALARLAASAGGTFTVAGTARQLPTSVEVVLLRAVQESLANVRKHAGATTVAVTLGYAADAVALEVCDDGRGFTPATDGSGPGYGLASMRARVEQIAGSLTVDSAPGRGTTVRISVPVPEGATA
ncbi:sensor histidine kinase [Phytohabitans kaempferiae]|uniref:Oxygen sensor histidine kinase NreB n=1 Tax=Phytohabitans kaempferiae TaxID=1620943 RepID=A0ABV6M2M4_9ACTN